MSVQYPPFAASAPEADHDVHVADSSTALVDADGFYYRTEYADGQPSLSRPQPSVVRQPSPASTNRDARSPLGHSLFSPGKSQSDAMSRSTLASRLSRQASSPSLNIFRGTEQLLCSSFDFGVDDEPEEEAILRRKIDLHCLPCLFMLYLLNFQARACIGNAREGGMAQSLALTSSDYALVLCIFFLGYGVFEVPCSLWISSSKPSLILPAMLFVSGLLCVGATFAKSRNDLIVYRLLLGISESGFFSGIVNYMHRWYKVEEAGKRFAVIFSAGILAGSVDGAAAAVIVTKLDKVQGLEGWKWLLLIIGLGAAVVAMAAFFVLPDYPSNTSWLTPAEKSLATQRLRKCAGQATVRHSWLESLRMAATDLRTWLMCAGYIGIHIAGSVSYFIPTIIGQHGHKRNAAELLSAVPYLVTLLAMFPVLLHSDLKEERGYHAIAATACAALMALLLSTLPLTPWAVFALLCIFGAATWTGMVCYIMWIATVFEGQEKRVACTAIIISSANVGIVTGSFLWPRKHAPRYTQDWLILAVACLVNVVVTVVIRFWLSKPRKLPSPGQEVKQSNECPQPQIMLTSVKPRLTTTRHRGNFI
ncbi:unnamed protein product [Parajaminaea phylloscopi]